MRCVASRTRSCVRRRAVPTTRRAPPAGLLEQGHALGLAALAIPEALGGAATERSSVTNAIIAEELARGDMGLAVALLAPLAVVHAVVAWGTAEQQARYLPAFLGDRFVAAALAVLEPRPLFDPMRPRLGAVRADGGRWALWGEKSLVPLAVRAELFVVAADVRGLGTRLFVVERERQDYASSQSRPWVCGARDSGICDSTTCASPRTPCSGGSKGTASSSSARSSIVRGSPGGRWRSGRRRPFSTT